MAAEEGLGEEPVVVGLGGGDLLHLRRLILQLYLEDLRHVRRCLLRVPGHERGVAGGLRHLQPGVQSHHRRHGSEHENDAPHVVGLRHRGSDRVDGVRRRREPVLEDAGDDDGDHSACKNAEALHRKNGRDERAAGPLVGVLGHDGGGEGVVAADAEAEPESEEAEGGHDALGGVAKGEAGGDGGDDHEQERHAVDSLAAELVAEPAEEELAGEGADEGDAVDGRGDVRRECPRGGGAIDVVVDAA